MLLAVIGLTILRIHQLISVHLFVGPSVRRSAVDRTGRSENGKHRLQVCGRGQLVLIHKASFIVWIVCMSVHVLGLAGDARLAAGRSPHGR